MSRLTASDFLWVAMGGALGTLLRELFNSVFAYGAPDAGFFTSTYTVNILGCFFIGHITARFAEVKLSTERQLFLITGLIGSFTTYSGFGIEAMSLAAESPFLFSGYLFSQVFVGVILFILGVKSAK